jgi:hypothetical protein
MISEVYNRDSYLVVNAKEDIKNGDAGTFSNMPRNVYHNQNDTGPLKQKNHLDIAPALLLYLSQHYTNYSFYVKTRTRYTDKNEEYMTMRDIYVFDGDEPVGRISRGERYSNNHDGLEFENNRISLDLKRGSAKKTAKLSTAKSLFAQYFYGMTIREHMEAMASSVRYEVSSSSYQLSREYDTARSKLTDYIKTEVARANETVLKFLKDMGKTDLIDAFHHTQNELQVVKNIESVVDKRNGYYVLLKEDEYFKWHQGESTPKRFKRDEMPSDMRMALGLLKIADKNTFVDGAGFKLADDKFFIRNEVQLDFDS